MSERVPIAVVDAFAPRPFRGNPAAVCVLESAAGASWMQAVAGELNLSETCFLVRRPDGGWDLRWFTPSAEVALCGHATLASAHLLWESGRVPAGEAIRFHTRSGWLTCEPGADGIRMDFPARPAEGIETPSGLASALGADVRWCGRTADDLLVELPHAATLRRLEPDLSAIGHLPVRGVIVTTASDIAGYDFLSRFFAPAVGVPEDPVTGSAHCSLAAFWGQRLGRTRMTGWQASRRGGEVGVEWRGDRVDLIGRAVTVWEGSIVGDEGGA